VVFFYVPPRDVVPDIWVARYLLLFESPLWELLGRGGEDALEKVVVQPDLGGKRLDDVAVATSLNLHAPHVVRVAGAVLKEGYIYTVRTVLSLICLVYAHGQIKQKIVKDSLPHTS
jgi:hypothetical protein